MNSLYSRSSHSAFAAATSTLRPCHGSLAAGKALRLRAQRRSVLRISQGRLWATFDGPHRGAANDLGDLVLDAGDSLDLAPGRSLVIQSWGTLTSDPVQFSVESASQDGWPCPPDGLFAPTRHPARLTERNQTALTMMLFGMINWTFTWLRPDGPMSYADFAEEVVAMLERGLAGASNRRESSANA